MASKEEMSKLIDDFVEKMVGKSIPMTDGEIYDAINEVFVKTGAINWIEKLKVHELVDVVDPASIQMFGKYTALKESVTLRIRDAANELCGYPILTNTLMDTLAAFIIQYTKKVHPMILDLGCGLGAISKCLRDRGINTIAVDNESARIFNFELNRWIPDIQKMDMYDAVDQFIGKEKCIDMCLLSWPTYLDGDDPYFADLMRKIYEYDLNMYTIYIGEGDFGCTANPEFFDAIETVDHMSEVNAVYQTYDWIHDYFMLIRYIPDLLKPLKNFPDLLKPLKTF